MEWGRGRSSGSRRGKRGGGGSSSDKPRQPQRGLGVAQLEKIRLESETAGYLHHPLGQPPPSSIHGTGTLSLGDARSSNSLSSSPSSSFHANINVSSPYPIHPNLAMMAYGGRSGYDIRYGESRSTTHPATSSPPNYHGAIYGASAHYNHSSSDATLSLFEPEDSICLRGQHEANQSAGSSGSMNSDDPQDVDLELKL